MPLKDKTPLGILCVLACEVLWGFSFMFTKTVTDTVSPLALLSWRFILALLVMSLLALLRIVKLDFRHKSLKALLLLAVFVPGSYFIGETVGIKLTSASESGAIIACIPVGALLLSTLMLKQPPTKLQVGGVGLTTAGIIFILLAKGLSATFNPLGYLLLLLAVVSYGLYSVYAQRASQFSSAEKTYAMMAMGAIVFTILALIESARDHSLFRHRFPALQLRPYLNRNQPDIFLRRARYPRGDIGRSYNPERGILDSSNRRHGAGDRGRLPGEYDTRDKDNRGPGNRVLVGKFRWRKKQLGQARPQSTLRANISPT